MDLHTVVNVTADVLSFTETVIGKEEQITFNTNIKRHCKGGSYNNTQEVFDCETGKWKTELLDDDFTTIGGEGQPVTLNDLKRIIDNIRSQYDKVKDNGRSYYYEGLEQTKHNEYSIMWGS